MNGLVILDMDGVIVKGQSHLIFLNYILRKKFVGVYYYLKIYIWFLFYKMGLAKNPRKIMVFAFSFLRDRKAEDIKDIVDKFFSEELHKFIFPEIIDIINKHKSQGRGLVIISNAADILVQAVANYVGVANFIGTRLEIADGRFTGEISGDIAYGRNKVILAQEFVKNNNLNFENSLAYADHISDLDLLSRVSSPFAVNPDRFLMTEAKKRSWPILIFKK